MNNRYLSAMPGFHYELALHLFLKKESSNHLATLSMPVHETKRIP